MKKRIIALEVIALLAFSASAQKLQPPKLEPNQD